MSLTSKLKNVFPKLSKQAMKGDHGRIGVIGGSYEYTGAPFYSAISALKVGGDLAHIFCSKSSAIAIKSYSPQIIVHPTFIQKHEKHLHKNQKQILFEEYLHKFQSWENAIQAWVIGPGLGRDPYMNEFFPELLKTVGRGKVVVFDADGIYYLNQYPHLRGYLKQCRTILIQNEKGRGLLKPYINQNLLEEINYKQKKIGQIQEIENKDREMKCTLILKGEEDIVLGLRSFVVRAQGGLKRCGGIGNILAGVAAICSLWDIEYGPALASVIVRKATKRAYDKQERGLTAPNIIRELPGAVKEIEEGIQDLD